MEQRLGFDLKLSQQLRLSTAQVLGLEVLQLPILQLEELLRQELESNPLIELEEPESSPSPEEDTQPDDFSFVIEGGNLFVPEEREELPLPAKTSLQEILKEQARLEFSDGELPVALYIIENLDSGGYFTEPASAVAEKFGVSEELVERVRRLITRFTPAGCGSRDLKEAVKAQLEELGASGKFLKAVDYLELLPQEELFLKKSGLKRSELKEFKELLKRVDPSPGAELDAAVKVEPDVKVWLEEGSVKVWVPEVRLSSFRINPAYLRLADEQEVKKFVREKYQRALYLKKALEQRRKTLAEIARCVFNRQRRFLEDGKSLRPLSYSEVAAAVRIHESTVSRAVKDKFVETPFGVFPFKLFFPKGVSGTSVDSVKEAIRRIIESEDKRKPLSDSKIARLLAEQGIKVARRTVAKYREEMGIPGAFKRKVREGA
ncbi:RNA polymerase, sigma 54 subunit, RpoN [Thermovibrio ammonificans HB-1]|uniref:RNA polymerase, sigma 54 subunit, RpoN n=1 Tax=Thermovibrio ammonificans (strain DSM 15698 / JCM 12110 / HB-1) TaxID=648996 RepID=E8T5A0_THEA1|nr:RNA polymerase factor sigma-54 [Thermovibrio ammonificans]ADU96438.1 RNA polymerase, sigma 54 subunit, RpoN [Thermovibrio ammonificans HB-1]